MADSRSTESMIEDGATSAPATEAPGRQQAPDRQEAPGTREAPGGQDAAVRLQLTPRALEEIRQMLAEEDLGSEGGLRLTARSGAGCSAPLQYGMFLEESPEPDDEVLTAGDVRIFLSPEDAWSLDGLLVDYVSSPHLGEGFAFRHPAGPHGRSC